MDVANYILTYVLYVLQKWVGWGLEVCTQFLDVAMLGDVQRALAQALASCAREVARRSDTFRYIVPAPLWRRAPFADLGGALGIYGG